MAAAAAAAAAVAPAAEHPEHEPLSLLHLPDLLIQLVLSWLTTAADVAACAATCSALRALVHGASWQHIGSFRAHRWTPALRGSLQWAASCCPQVSAWRPTGDVQQAMHAVLVRKLAPCIFFKRLLAGLLHRSLKRTRLPACSCAPWTSLVPPPAVTPTCCPWLSSPPSPACAWTAFGASQ